MNRRRSLSLRTFMMLGVTVVAAAGCKAPAEVGEPTEWAPEATAEVNATPLGGPAVFDHPAIELPPTSRGIKRLTVQQLRGAIDAIAGPDGSWTVKVDGQEIDVLSPQALARTLGEPDYIAVTHEAAEPTALYAKFMTDMARDVCAKLDAADDLRVGENAVENLARLKLRMLGERVADGDAEAVADLVAVLDAGGYTAVCVALMTSPAFHLY
jgi:hypothetical protein